MTARIVVIHPNREFTEKTAATLGQSYRVDAGTNAGSISQTSDPADLLICDYGDNGDRGSWRHPALRRLLVVPSDRLASATRSLGNGVDDFITEPVDFNELAARTSLLISRPPRNGQRQRTRIFFDRVAYAIRSDGEILNLSPAELRLMIFFLDNTDRAFSRQELLQGAWRGQQITERAVDVTIRRLRKELEARGCDGMIQTVRGIGYRFVHDD